ncbi:hypothetical protein C2S53_003218 [Perilla frutescens var. hirtella]|uniref:Uncharacterized protein n=1 Tax=Perilla frutescens var. hirtella TaxID=608512 RepID=A0AAD4JKB5_PERFH|nr:hypothetical protein C2S53_003218 [Perilla frutescens var. hirtella]
MQFSQVLGFLKIVKESMKLVPKNGKLMASITTFTIVPPSVGLLLLLHFHKFLTKKVDKAISEYYFWFESDHIDNGFTYTPNQIIAYNLALLLLAAIPFALTCYLISYLSTIAVILVSAASYTGKKSSFKDLLSRIKSTCTRLNSPAYFRSSRTSITRFQYVAVLAPAFAAAYLVLSYPNNAIALGIVIAVMTSLLIFGHHVSVVEVLSGVISVVEESPEKREAVEKAQVLVVGNRLHGFMLNFIAALPIWIHVMAYNWMLLVDSKWYLNFNIAVHGLIFLNSIAFAKIFVCTAYTVLYFRCKKHASRPTDSSCSC